MGQISLKDALFYIKDGADDVGNAAITGATLRRAGLAGLDNIQTTMTGNVKINQTFTITGETGTPPTHTVRAFTQQGGNTTSIVFYPPLTANVAAGAAMTIPLLAATGANIIEIRTGAGDFSYDEARNMDYRLNRGKLDSVREGDEIPLDVSFQFVWEYKRSDTGEPVTIEEALKQVGNASDWVTTSIDPCEPYAVDLIIRYHPPCDSSKDEMIIFEDFRWEGLSSSVSNATISCKGKCNTVSPTITRVTQTTLNEYVGMFSDTPMPGSPEDTILEEIEEEEVAA